MQPPHATSMYKEEPSYATARKSWLRSTRGPIQEELFTQCFRWEHAGPHSAGLDSTMSRCPAFLTGWLWAGPSSATVPGLLHQT